MEATLTRISYYVYNPQILIAAREKANQSVQDVADGTKLDRATVWRVENGRAASYESVERICVFLNLVASEVIKPTDNKQEARGKHSKKISVIVA